MKLWAVHPSCQQIPKGVRWIYADDDLAGYTSAATRFGTENRLLSPAAFQSEMLAMSEDFLRWIDDALEGLPADYWIPASFLKDIYCTPMFLHFACLRMAISRAAQGQNIAIITNSLVLTRQIQSLNQRSFAAHLNCTVADILELIPEFFRFIGRALLLYLRSRVAGHFLQQFRFERPQILVDTFLFEGDISSDGRFRDRFFPGLVEWFNQNSVAAASMPFTGNIRLSRLPAVYKAMHKCRVPFVVIEQYLGIFDFLAGMGRALTSFFRPPAFSKAAFARSCFSSLAQHWWRISALNTVTAQIIRRAPRNLSRLGMAPNWVLEWYENQPIDKALTLGFQRECAGVKVIAGRQYFPASGVVNFFTTPGEVTAKAAPAINWTCGQQISRLFAMHDPVGIYRTVPALRYKHLFESTSCDKQETDLVIFLTSWPEESIGILECVFAAPSGARKVFKNIFIKSHQSLRGNIRSQAEQRLPAMLEPGVSWPSSTTEQLLQTAKLVVTAGSSVALEAICCGVPVAVVGRSAGIGVNPLKAINIGFWREAYGPDDFFAISTEWLRNLPDLVVRREIGITVRDEFFERPSADSMASFDPRIRETAHSPTHDNQK